jgi:hypothetical protein
MQYVTVHFWMSLLQKTRAILCTELALQPAMLLHRHWLYVSNIPDVDGVTDEHNSYTMNRPGSESSRWTKFEANLGSGVVLGCGETWGSFFGSCGGGYIAL